jgi:hypothetical protein
MEAIRFLPPVSDLLFTLKHHVFNNLIEGSTIANNCTVLII